MKIGYLDCVSGISGDMMLGALVDVGVPLEHLNEAVQSLGISNVSLTQKVVKRSGFRAMKVDVLVPHEHEHRHLSDIFKIIARSSFLDDSQKGTIRQMFQMLAEAEAKVHGTSVEKVHFHEVGAVDSIVDIVATVVGLSYLKLEYLASSPVPTGCGTIKIAHGVCSIPTPATTELLSGIPIEHSDIPFELTTPTGAVILKRFVRLFGPVPTLTIRKTGCGAGTRDIEGHPNVLRFLYGETINPQHFISRTPNVPSQFSFADKPSTLHSFENNVENNAENTKESNNSNQAEEILQNSMEHSHSHDHAHPHDHSHSQDHAHTKKVAGEDNLSMEEVRKLREIQQTSENASSSQIDDEDQDVLNALDAIEDAMLGEEHHSYAGLVDSIGLENPGLIAPFSLDDHDLMKESWEFEHTGEEDSSKDVLSGVIQEETIWVLETNLDDMSGEILGYCFEKLWALDILDAYTTPILMKKGRSGMVLTVLCREHIVSSVERVLFMETTTLGIRKHSIQRSFLDRKSCRVKTPWGDVVGKVATMPDGTSRFSPEYESAKIIAELNFVPLQKVYDTAKKSFTL